jgi:uncharacterized membrane protein
MLDEPNKIKYIEFIILLIFFVFVVILAILLFLSSGIVRVVAGVLIVFILPGYLLLQILWPSNESLDLLRRITLILPTSMAIVGVLLLIVNYFFVYHYENTVMALAVLEIFLGLTANSRSKKFIPSMHSISKMRTGVISMKAPKWDMAQIFLGISILIFSISITHTFITPRQSRDTTEFFLNEPGSYIESQHRNIKNGGSQNLMVAIGNYESGIHEYHIEVWGVKSPDGESMLINMTDKFYVRENKLVEKMIPLNFPPDFNSQGVEVLLFIDDDPDPYRRLLFWMDVET